MIGTNRNERHPAIALVAWCAVVLPACRDRAEDDRAGRAAPGDPPPRAEITADFYVSPRGNDDWSGTLPEPNEAGDDGPFASPRAARDAVRKRVARGLEKDILVLLCGGTYFLPGGITFTPADSGTDAHAITYAAFPGERPALVGGVTLAGLAPCGKGRLRAAVPRKIAPAAFFQDRRRLTFARHPNEGYARVVKPANTKAHAAFTYHPAELGDPGTWDIAGASVNIWPYHDWFNRDIPLKAVDTASRTITLKSKPQRLRAGNRFYVWNVPQLLDRPGECHYDEKSRTLTLLPRKTSAAPTVIAASAEHVLAVAGDGKDGIVRNLHFRGLDIGICTRDAVSVRGAERCSLRFCLIENAHRRGVVISGRARHIAVYGCLIRYHGQHGVSLRGPGLGSPYVNKHNRVENCHIHHCGRLVGHGYGVRISQSGENRVCHNHIHHMPRYATSIKGTRFHAINKKIDGLTWEHRYDFFHSRKNLIAFNDIHDVNTDSQDTGAMESWGPGRDNVYDHNLIRNCGNDEFNLQSGIYLDDASDYFTVSNNIIYGIIGTSNNQPIYAKGIGNRIVNNILVVGPRCDRAIASFAMADERCDHHAYLRNIVYFAKNGKPRAGGGRSIYHFQNWTKDRVTACDRNVYFDPRGGPLAMSGTMPPGCPDRSLASWRQARGGTFDARSVVADPLFVDPAARDFRLAPGSPALRCGFAPIDTSGIGLKDDFPARFERD